MQNMMIQLLTLAAGAIMAVLAILAFRETSENYDRMPDRIPMHFGLSGKADSWSAKNKFTAYLMPGFTFFPLAMLIAVYLMMQFSGEIEYDAMLFMSLILTPVAWMMFNVNRAIIDYSLGKAESVWPYMKWPMIVLVLLVAASMSFLAMSMRRPAEFLDAAIYDSVDARMRPGRPVTEFTGEEKYIYALTSWKNLNGKPELRYNWYAPDGELVHKGKDKLNLRNIKSKRKVWYRLDLDYYRKRGVALSGRWKLEIFLNGNPVKTQEFVMP